MFYITLLLTKLTNLGSRLFHIGSGYTWPGHIALNIYPTILQHKKLSFPKGIILISGTNGKTTTSKILTHILEKENLKVVHNKTGANLLNGITSSILLSMDIFGNHHADVGVFEVDENNLPLAIKYLQPTTLVLLNLSRDQLDRYGEVDIILEKWCEAVKLLPVDSSIVLDVTQKYFNVLKNCFAGKITYFSEALDYFKHTKLLGSFNAKNVNAAVEVCLALGVTESAILNALETFEYAYGRGETIFFHDKEYKVLLAKNPASFNTNVQLLLNGILEYDTVLFILNDNIPDGRDISWIYDIDQNALKDSCQGKQIYISGTRYLDMCIRLNYAGIFVESENFQEDTQKILDNIHNNKKCSKVLVLPNYSAMLHLRKLLLGKAIL